MLPTAFGMIETHGSQQDNDVAPIGGFVKKFTPGASFLGGDYVYVSAANTVNKSTNQYAYYAKGGFVVAGPNAPTYGRILHDFTSNVLGVQVAASTDPYVLVQHAGVAWGIAGGTIAVGSLLVPDNGVAGRVVVDRAKTITTASDAWVNPAAASANAILTTTAGPNNTTSNPTLNGALASGGVATIPHARNVVITVTHASAVVALSGVITGTDIRGNAITESWAVTAGTTSKTFTGKKGFKTVTNVSVIASSDASSDSIVIGTGVVFGLSQRLVEAGAVVKEVVDGSVVTNGTFVGTSVAAADDAFGTYSPNTAPDGAHDYTVYYLTDGAANGLSVGVALTAATIGLPVKVRMF